MYPVYSDPHKDLICLIEALEAKPRYFSITPDECDFLLDENLITPIDERFNTFEFEHGGEVYQLRVER